MGFQEYDQTSADASVCEAVAPERRAGPTGDRHDAMSNDLFMMILGLFVYVIGCGVAGSFVGHLYEAPLTGAYYGLWFGLITEVGVPLLLVN